MLSGSGAIKGVFSYYIFTIFDLTGENQGLTKFFHRRIGAL